MSRLEKRHREQVIHPGTASGISLFVRKRWFCRLALIDAHNVCGFSNQPKL
jgi:hypothetical protein